MITPNGTSQESQRQKAQVCIRREHGVRLRYPRGLRELGAPAGSVLEYRLGEQKMSVEIA
jgi:hypothetical protein